MISGRAEISYEELRCDSVPELKVAKEHFEGIWKSKPGLLGSLSQTGERYIVIVPGGFKEEGREFPIWCSSIDVAVNLWRKAIYNYADGKPGTIYWRDEPSLCVYIIKDKIGATRLYTVYSRLLISDSPELQAA